jgi:hypothetical protein
MAVLHKLVLAEVASIAAADRTCVRPEAAMSSEVVIAVADGAKCLRALGAAVLLFLRVLSGVDLQPREVRGRERDLRLDFHGR